MKITVTNIEADPAEILEVPELKQLLGQLAGGGGERFGSPDRADSTTTDEVGSVWHFLELRGRGHRHLEVMRDFVKACLEFEGAEPVLGRSRKSPDGYGDYLMIRHESHRKGAFVYVTPSSGKLKYRLPREAVQGRKYAKEIPAQGENHRVRVDLKTKDALAEAIELAKLAYDGVKP